MNTIKQRLLTNWHWMRILRLALAVWLLVTAVETSDMATGLFSVFFLYTAIAGVGCCGPRGCYTPMTENEDSSDINYEEIK
ncbi:MAG TPA: hypothetical protein VHC47_06225 [Mucilaginibacter sp.]|nr:hypothetical protein [Mucilaginibacter sp.]